MLHRSLGKAVADRRGILVALLAINVVFCLCSRYYCSLSTLNSVVTHAAFTMILSTGMVFVIATGGIDVSVGSTMAFSGIVVAMLMKAGLDPALAAACGLLVGAAIGFANGAIITKVGLQPLIVTLAMLSIVRGSAICLSKGYAITGLPESFSAFFAGRGAIRNSVFIGFGIAALGALVANWTPFGLYARGVGGSQSTVYICGKSPALVKIAIYTVQGVLAVVASMVFMASVDAAEPSAGLSTEWLEAIAAPIIGGNSLSGGEASIFGTIIGALILSSVRSGLNAARVAPSYQQVAIGLLIVVSVVIGSSKSSRAR